MMRHMTPFEICVQKKGPHAIVPSHSHPSRIFEIKSSLMRANELNRCLTIDY